MSEDIIKVSVDTTEMEAAIAMAKQYITLGTTLTGTPNMQRGLGDLLKKTSRTKKTVDDLSEDLPLFLRQMGVADLPGVNRELRLIIGSVPGLRILVADYFRLKRIQRSVGLAVEEAKTLRDVLTNPQMILTIVATLILAIRTIIKYFEKMKRERILYEEFLRRERGLTKREFDALRVITGRKNRPGAGTIQQYYWGNPE